MLIALLADIHANREALTACLADAESAGVDQYVFLGDLVGYGADPEWVVDRVADMVEAGAIAVLGNHDAAALQPERIDERGRGRGDRVDAHAARRSAPRLPRRAAVDRRRGRSALCARERERAG